MVERRTTGPITIERQWFIDSRQGNIKDEYYFEKKLGSGGYGAVYLAKHKKTGKFFKTKHTQTILLISLPCLPHSQTLSLSKEIKKKLKGEDLRNVVLKQLNHSYNMSLT